MQLSRFGVQEPSFIPAEFNLNTKGTTYTVSILVHVLNKHAN